MRDDIDAPAANAGGFSATLDKAEAFYLKVLRAGILLIATGLIIYSAWLAISGLYQIARSPESVEEKSASVAASEVAELEDSPPLKDDSGSSDPRQDKATNDYLKGFGDRYFALYQKRFEPYRQPDDKRLDRQQFDDEFIQSQRRAESIANGTSTLNEERAHLDRLIETMTAASAHKKIIDRLERYRGAKRVRVERSVRRTRTETRRGWDRNSMACADWFYEPYGCSVTRRVEVPYTTKVASLELPEGVSSPSQTFRAMQDRYFSLLEERRTSNSAAAESEREAISLGNIVGRESLFQALIVLGGFLILMFFFLLIAIERHQRKQAV